MNITKKVLSAILALTLTTSIVQASQVANITVHSAKMKRDIPATIILPDSYKTSQKKYPVLYLLHGAGDNNLSWVSRTDIKSLADQYDIIIACPDAGRTSWYFDSPIDKNYQYETFVAKEFVEYVDKNYRTIAKPQNRGTCGNSMGGHGALFLAIRHPKTFGTAVALSGGVDIRPFADKWDIKKRIGDINDHQKEWDELSVINLAKNLKNGDLAISIDCGTGDFFLKVNRALHQQLLDAGIKHDYIEKPGGHGWVYWKKAIKRQMPFIKEHIASSDTH
jgi:S-formylglutathione hydrolase FrmB